MERWNGWGDEKVHMELPPKALALLEGLVGESRRQIDCSVDEIIGRIPDSRLPAHSGISVDRRERLLHAHGQSLPDWVDLRCGTLKRFPDGVACPTTREDLEALFTFAEKNNVVVIPYGGGTSVVGHLQVPDDDRPVLSISMKRIKKMTAIEPSSLLATFETGVRGPDLEARLRGQGFTLGHYPQSFEYSSLGGWIVTRSSGQQAMHYGGIDDLFIGGEVLTPRGILRLPDIPTSAAGPDLRHLVLGSEGRMGILTKATVKISPLPEVDDVYGVFLPSWDDALEATRILAGSGLPFSMIRLSNPMETMTNLYLAGHEREIALLKKYLAIRGIPEEGSCMCLIGFIGSKKLTGSVRGEAFSIIRKHKGVSVGRAMGKAWKKNRFQVPYLRNTLWEMGYAIDTFETALPWDRVDDTMQEIERVVGKGLLLWDENVHVFTHLSRLYPIGSSIYTTCVFRIANTPDETMERWKTLKNAVSRVIVDAGGPISHQHGVGIDHKPYLEAEKGALGMDIIDTICTMIDPEKRMNPTKLL